ncbi:MAG: urea transporter ATP-binding subunit UrtE, partial [Pseudomonadota bacterium]
LSRIENPSVGTALAESYTALQFFAWDEPTEGIQPSIIKDIGRVIRMLAGRGNMAILLCEQYYDFAEELADDYLVMERGEVIAMGLGSEMQSKGIRQLVSI